MVRRFFAIMAVCFLLTPLSISYADIIYGGPLAIVESTLITFMIIGVIAGMMALIRAFWKLVKGNKGND